MNGSSHVHALLERIGAEEGDTLRIETDGQVRTGTLMPHHAFSRPDVIVIKLKNGYNIGIRLTESTEVVLLKKGAPREKVPRPLAGSPGKKELAVIGTGGTIASYIDYRTGAVHPALSAGDMVAAVPEMLEICNVKADVLFSIFSENMKVSNWKQLAIAVADAINAGADGVLVPHGTDTMGYTSAALSFMLDGLTVPVVLVGAQRSSDRPSSDAYTNLLSGARFAVTSDIGEVVVLMHETSSDTVSAVHRGTKVRKMHTSRRDAFKSINSDLVARVHPDGKIEELSVHRRRSKGKVSADTQMEENVSLLYFYPGMSPSRFRTVLKESAGVVIAGSGLGHVSSDIVEEISHAVKGGTKVVMTSQCLSGRVNLNVYDTGRDLRSAGIIPGEDMLPETAYVKLMWVLGRTDDMEEVRRLMLTDLKGEIAARRELDE